MKLIIPIVFLLICSFLVFLPLYVRPMEVGMGLLITATGVPVYFAGVYWRNKPKWMLTILGETNTVKSDICGFSKRLIFISQV